MPTSELPADFNPTWKLCRLFASDGTITGRYILNGKTYKMVPWVTVLTKKLPTKFSAFDSLTLHWDQFNKASNCKNCKLMKSI